MRTFRAAASLLACGACILLWGCGPGEQEYKIEGPKATENPSVGAAVGAGSAPGQPAPAPTGDEVPGGKGKMPSRGR